MPFHRAWVELMSNRPFFSSKQRNVVARANTICSRLNPGLAMVAIALSLVLAAELIERFWTPSENAIEIGAGLSISPMSFANP